MHLTFMTVPGYNAFLSSCAPHQFSLSSLPDAKLQPYKQL